MEERIRGHRQTIRKEADKPDDQATELEMALLKIDCSQTTVLVKAREANLGLAVGMLSHHGSCQEAASAIVMAQERQHVALAEARVRDMDLEMQLYTLAAAKVRGKDWVKVRDTGSVKVHGKDRKTALDTSNAAKALGTSAVAKARDTLAEVKELCTMAEASWHGTLAEETARDTSAAAKRHDAYSLDHPHTLAWAWASCSVFSTVSG